ncbi:MAG: Uma2 family endonuclease [Archangium sp.]|nr:Uma2 family endonuclease [Archangium sp.]
MAQPARPLISFDEYLRIEGDSLVKHEFLDGVVWAMGGGTDEHAAIAANVIRILGNQLLGKPCRVYTSDLRVRVRATGLTTYPDASVICDRVTFDAADPKRTTALNPKVLVEVTSPSTATYDRGEKLDHYKRIASAREIVIVAHDEKRIEVWRKSGSRWTRTEHRDVAPLQSINCTLSVADVYLDPFAD